MDPEVTYANASQVQKDSADSLWVTESQNYRYGYRSAPQQIRVKLEHPTATTTKVTVNGSIDGSMTPSKILGNFYNRVTPKYGAGVKVIKRDAETEIPLKDCTFGVFEGAVERSALFVEDQLVADPVTTFTTDVHG